MNAQELVMRLNCDGVSIRLHEGKLRCEAEQAVLTDDIMSLLRENRGLLVAYLHDGNKGMGNLPPVESTAENTSELYYRQVNWWNAVKGGRGFVGVALKCRMLEEEVDTEIFLQAFMGLVDRHDMLRVSCHKDPSGELIQTVHEKSEIKLKFIDLTGADPTESVKRALGTDVPTDDLMAEIHSYLRNYKDVPEECHLYDVGGPLYRACLVKRGERRHEILFYMDHLITDGISLSIIERDLVELYRSLKEGRNSNLPKLPFRYIDYANWGNKYFNPRSVWFRRDERFWNSYYSDMQPLRMAHDNVEPGKDAVSGTGTLRFKLPPGLSKGLCEVGGTENLTEFNLLFSAYYVAISRIMSRSDMTIATIMSGRGNPGTQDIVGHFAEMLFVKMNMDGDLTFVDLARKLTNRLIELQMHLNVNMTPILPLGVSSIDSREAEPRTSSSFVFSGELYRELTDEEVVEFDQKRYELLPSDEATSPKLIWLRASSRNNEFYFIVSYNVKSFRRTTIENIISGFGLALEQMVKSPRKRIA